MAVHGDLGKHLRFYAGLRPDVIEMKNTDKMKPTYSFDEWKVIENPKATLAWTPGTGPARWLPSASFSIGQAFFHRGSAHDHVQLRLPPHGYRSGGAGLSLRALPLRATGARKSNSAGPMCA
jgi:hypothetical protein